MVKYMGGEFYKVTRRKYLYITLGCMAVLEALLVVLWAWMNGAGDGMTHIAAASGFTMVLGMLSMGFFFTILTCDMVFSEQYKHNTLKNEVSFGVSRTRIYLGKLAVEAVVSLALCLVIFVWYGVLCLLLLPGDRSWAEALGSVGFGLLAALPTWMGCLSLVHMLFFLLRGTTAASMIVAVLVTTAGQLFQLLAQLVNRGFLVLYNILFTSPLEGIINRVGDWSTVGWAWAVGAGWFLVTTLVGLAAFQKKEIN